MPFYGDPYPVERWYGDLIVTSMSTALLKIYTSQGFVLAADGLKQKIEDDGTVKVESKFCQKLFPVKQSDRMLAYSLTGTVQLGGETSQSAGFDFAARTRDAIDSMADSKATNLKAYVTEVCESLNALLAHAKANGLVESYPTSQPQWADESGHTIVEILFDGYYQGEPSSVRARLFHDNQVLAVTQVTKEDVDAIRIDGSSEIANRLFRTDDPLFGKYRRLWTANTPLLLAIQKAKSYFRACADTEVRKLDKHVCATIGGWTHIATITPQAGFRWVRRPKPKGAK